MKTLRLCCINSIFVLGLMVPLNQASEAPIINPKTRFHPVYGTLGMVVTQEALWPSEYILILNTDEYR